MVKKLVVTIVKDDLDEDEQEYAGEYELRAMNTRMRMTVNDRAMKSDRITGVVEPHVGTMMFETLIASLIRVPFESDLADRKIILRKKLEEAPDWITQELFLQASKLNSRLPIDDQKN